jgi:glutamine synthetase
MAQVLDHARPDLFSLPVAECERPEFELPQELEAGEPQNVNLYTLSQAELDEQGIAILPQNLGEALDALAADTVLAERIGSEIIGEFLKVKKMEWIEYSRHVSSWEVDRYIDFF